MSKWKVVVSVAVAAALGVGWGYPQGRSPSTLSVQDYNEIQRLYASYAFALDTGDGPGFASTWTSDGEFTRGRPAGQGQDERTPLKGTDAFTRMGNGGGGSRHFTTNLIITPTAEGATGTSYLLLFSLRTTPPTLAETAIYKDILVKTAQGWRFKTRVAWRDDDDISPFRKKPATP